MKKIMMLLLVSVGVMLSGCNAAKELQSVYNLQNCKYKYHSITNLRVADMNLSDGLSVVNAVKLTALLNSSASSIPLNFTLNMDIYNPNPSDAAFQGMQYMIRIDDVDFTTGHISEPFRVESGKTEQLPVHIGVDLAKLIAENSKQTIVNMAKNFIGIGNRRSEVTIQLKPTFNIGGSIIESPVYIPVSFTFGGP